MMAWPILFRPYIDDGFGRTKGSKTDVEFWISEFNKLVESIDKDKFKYGPKVGYMNLVIYKVNRFYNKGFSNQNISEEEESLCIHPTEKQS